MNRSMGAGLGRRLRVCSAAMCLGCYAFNVNAGEPYGADSAFIALDGTVFSVGADEADDNASPGMRLRLGATLSPLVDLEGQLGFSFYDDTQPATTDVAVYGVYLKGYLPVGQYSSLFATGGMTVVDQQSVSVTADSYAGFSYGFGLETRLSEQLDLTADYMSYLSDTDDRGGVSAVSFGLKLYF